MAKQRPSKSPGHASPAWAANCASLKPASFWRKRVFKSTFTRGGQSIVVKGWAIRIQYQGKRRTFSLGPSNRLAAALKAGQIYQTILRKGWDIAAQLYARKKLARAQPAVEVRPPQSLKTSIRYWKLRLLRRRHSRLSMTGPGEEFAVRIEHGGISHFFPLGALAEEAAATKALEIYRTVVSKGWDTANRWFSRELTLGFHWATNPVAWTYTTIHTRIQKPETPPQEAKDKSPLSIVIVEGDAGVQKAIAWHLRRFQPASNAVGIARGTDALREVPRHSYQLMLANHSLPDMSGDGLLQRMKSVAPQLPVLIYSVYEDSDELFKATPGGAAGYMLKRTLPEQMLEPIAGLLPHGPIKPQLMVQQVRQYFQNVTTLLQSGGEFHEIGRLTPREKEILGHLSKGYLDKEIAQSLGISVWTVHGHLKNIFEKLQVHSRTEAVVKFLQK
ncbi:MAG: response regulator transcription factor [Verrucomicrobia bacterium]|nr:response regulator transcription factor [Verrucomicrobiota bacterium]